MKEKTKKIIFVGVMTLVSIQCIATPVMSWLYIRERKKAKQLEGYLDSIIEKNDEIECDF